MRQIALLDEQDSELIDVEVEGDTVTFYWPCGDEFGFEVERLLIELKALRAAQPKLGTVITPLLGFEDNYLLQMGDQAVVEVIEPGTYGGVIARLDYAELRKVITNARREAMKATA